MLGGGEWKQINEVVTAYDGGVLPEALKRAVRDAQRVRQMTQQAVANQIGISRPQLANALQGRFGLSRSAASNLLEWLAA
jgi:DNA-binding phage protein